MINGVGVVFFGERGWLLWFFFVLLNRDSFPLTNYVGRVKLTNGEDRYERNTQGRHVQLNKLFWKRRH
jgi:hypothetical protein